MPTKTKTPATDWQNALSHMHLALGASRKVAALLGVHETDVNRWIRGENKPRQTQRDRITEVYSALRTEAQIGLAACIASVQALDRVAAQPTAAHMKSAAAKCKEQIMERYIGRLRTLEDLTA